MVACMKKSHNEQHRMSGEACALDLLSNSIMAAIGTTTICPKPMTEAVITSDKVVGQASEANSAVDLVGTNVPGGSFTTLMVLRRKLAIMLLDIRVTCLCSKGIVFIVDAEVISSIRDGRPYSFISPCDGTESLLVNQTAIFIIVSSL